MDHQAFRSVLYSQGCFYLGLIVCVIIKPHGLATNDGISYYGIYRETVLPYAFALLGAAYFCLQASGELADSHFQLLRNWLKIMAILLAGLVVTPYAAGTWVDYLHTTFGTILFAGQLLFSIWLIWQLHNKVWAIVLTVIEFFAGVASAIYLKPTHGLLLQTQVIFQLAFGALLLYSWPRLYERHNNA